MRLSSETIDRLYPPYCDHHEKLKTDVEAINRSWGSKNPEMKLQKLAHDEFMGILTTPHIGEEALIASRWIRRIARGHEAEFPELADILRT